MNTATLLLAAWTLVGAPDGDTLRLRQADTEVRVRLAEIDALESGQPYGRRAKKYLSALCYEAKATIRQTASDR